MSTGERGAARTGGFLSLEALRSGMREQYAVQRSYGTVVVELAFENGHFVVSQRITKPGVESTSTSKTHALLGMAHEHFSALVRNHP